MRRRRIIARLIGIQRVLVKYGLDDAIKQTHLLRPLRFFFYLFQRRRTTSAPLGERIRLALEELGPIFVKFGQAISTRRDLLPREIADELAKLQDEVPPFPAEVAVGILNDAYGEHVDEVFQRFDREPLAAASIAQVHTAQLPNGAEVIVKLLRPGGTFPGAAGAPPPLNPWRQQSQKSPEDHGIGHAPAVWAQPPSRERKIGHRGGDQEQNRENSYKSNQKKHKFASQKNQPKILLKNTWPQRASPAILPCLLANGCVTFLSIRGLFPGLPLTGYPVAYVLARSSEPSPFRKGC